MNLQELLARLQKTKRNGNPCKYTALCPAHDDKKSSLSVEEAPDGKILVHCHRGCTFEEIANALGAKDGDFFPDNSGNGKKEIEISLTVCELAADKKIPESFLRELGLTHYDKEDMISKFGVYSGGVHVPYYDKDMKAAKRQRIRTALKAKDGSKWDTKGKGATIPYGIWRPQEDYCVIVEGESDSWTLWHHGFSAIGLPGADTFNKLELSHIEKCKRIYVVKEPDEGGKTLTEGMKSRLDEIGYQGRWYIIAMPDGCKDPNDLHRKNPEKFEEIFRAIMKDAEGEEYLEELQPIETAEDIDLDLSQLHPAFQHFWEQYAGKTEAPKEYVLTSLMIGMAAMLGNQAMLKIGFGIRANLYAILLGSSTFHRKTTSIDIGTDVLNKISEGQHATYMHELALYAEEMEEWNKAPKHDRGEKPEKPVDHTIIYPNEQSPEALLNKMSGKPDGIFIYSELGGLLARLNQSYMAGFKEKLTDFYDGRSKLYTRETISGGVIEVRNAAPSFLACSTFEWLQGHVEEDELKTGFLGRFLIVCRRKYPKENIPLPPFFQNDESWRTLFNQIGLFNYQVSLGLEAQKLYEDWYNKFKPWALDQDVRLHSFLGRLMTACHKIALIMHALEVNYAKPGDFSKRKPDVILADSYRLAFYWVDFFTRNISSCYSELTQAVDMREEKIRELIRKKGKERCGYMTLSQSEICHLGNFSKKDLLEITETLEEKRILKKLIKGKFVFWGIKL